MTTKQRNLEIHYCPHCYKVFRSNTFSKGFTTLCPHCGKMYGPAEMYQAATRLLKESMSLLGRSIYILTEDDDEMDHGTTREIVRTVIAFLMTANAQLPCEGEIEDIQDEMLSKDDLLRLTHKNEDQKKIGFPYREPEVYPH